MKNIREAVHDVIEQRVLPWIERDGISKLILPGQITPDDCAKPIKCRQPCKRWHREHELIIGLTGEAPYCIDGKRFIVAPGRMVLIPAGTPHTSDQTTPRFTDNIDPDLSSSSLGLMVFPFGIRIAIARILEDADTMEQTPSYMLLDWHFNRLMNDLLEEVRTRPPSYAGVARSILSEFMHRCVRASYAGAAEPWTVPTLRWPRSGSSGSGSRRKVVKAASRQLSGRVQLAQDFIHSNYHAFIGLEDVAEASETSANHLGRLFKTATGMTPMQYLLDVRIAAARELLRTDLKVMEVARLVGIEDQYYFSRAFRRINGISPAQYRRRLVKNPFHQPPLQNPSK